MPDKQDIENAINDLLENYEKGEFSNLNLISSVTIKGDRILVCLDISDLGIDKGNDLKDYLARFLSDKFSDFSINIILTSKKSFDKDHNSLKQNDPITSKNINKNPGGSFSSTKSKIYVEGAKRVILVSSGKGGVGKSTVTALLAYSLKMEGKKVGILDADIYGPSIKQIFNIDSSPKLDPVTKKMIPIESQGIYINSIGLMIEEGRSVNWRGPMASKALYQLISLTAWDNLDYLLVDMPPGTGDIHISLMENYVIDGTILVTTPQKISEIDVERSVNFYNKFENNLIGIIENMSFYRDSKTNEKIKIFSGNAGEELAKKFALKLLDKIEIIPELSEKCDSGKDLSDYSSRVTNSANQLILLL